ncbi:MAG: hypothetical protein EBX47_10495 [Synechococcaceae bacterium WB8_1B_057]|nr:hypothetical protein [Synechococcaceae bacterium WB8_1B_057]
MNDRLSIINERTFTIPKVDFKQIDGKWSWVIKGGYSYGKKQIIQKLQEIVRTDRSFWLSVGDCEGRFGSNPELVCQYNALEEFLKSLDDQ